MAVVAFHLLLLPLAFATISPLSAADEIHDECSITATATWHLWLYSVVWLICGVDVVVMVTWTSAWLRRRGTARMGSGQRKVGRVRLVSSDCA